MAHDLLKRGLYEAHEVLAQAGNIPGLRDEDRHELNAVWDSWRRIRNHWADSVASTRRFGGLLGDAPWRYNLNSFDKLAGVLDAANTVIGRYVPVTGNPASWSDDDFKSVRLQHCCNALHAQLTVFKIAERDERQMDDGYRRAKEAHS
ncbi:Uncharacterised protein [Mycobacteroides abscessus subsp. abscessus]|uniref:hypothetical protein n=1 Tax=Mycobacteroides abscessus TaxID=36809 RepID=UPI000927EE13|nr:hypothetical protein [Mycobacteroides abscessus]SIA49339.1 Uncharacterised protein [Mycobacteroides abscessus subsp. abscessus]SIA69632.1 Uncharacterised protein [Mycobacteroides abscessus subsp. abscessus]